MTTNVGVNFFGTNIQYYRRELRERLEEYDLINDCVAGERVVKSRGTKHLPNPDPTDVDGKRPGARYQAYKTRAVFYNVARNTLNGLVGEVFAKDPVSEIPDGLNVVLNDADGNGLTLKQLAKKATRFTVAKGRAGILTDYPVTEAGASRLDVEQGRIQPTLTIYKAEDVINWRTVVDGNLTKLIMVVLRERVDLPGRDEFSLTDKYRYRILRLTPEDVYTVEIRDDLGGTSQEEMTPTDAAGNTFDRIPFTFIGSENNDHEIDYPPLYDLCSLNIAHYRNSADYEESSFVTGQATVAVIGLTEDWFKDVLKNKINLGSRGGIPLPEGGDVKLVQQEANGVPFEGMGHKERQMVALGARIVEQREVQRTATEATQDSSTESSILMDIAQNVSAAIESALEIAGRFIGIENVELSYQLNTDFAIAKMNAQDRQQTIAEWQAGMLTFQEARNALRRVGVATEDDNDAAEQIEIEEAERMRRAQEAMGNDNDDGENDNEEGNE